MAKPTSNTPRAHRRRHDVFEKITLATAIAGVVVVAASAGIAGYTAYLIWGQLNETKTADPIILAQSQAVVSISNTANNELLAAQDLASSASDQARSAKDQAQAAQNQVAQMKQAVTAERDQVAILRQQATVAEEQLRLAYRPKLALMVVSPGDITLTDKDISVAPDIAPINKGNLTAESYQLSVDLVGLQELPKAQLTSCAFADVASTKANSRNGLLPYTGRSDLPEGQGNPLTYYITKPLAEFRIPGNPDVLPVIFEGCISYAFSGDKRLHHMRFAYYWLELQNGGAVVLHYGAPRTIAKTSLILTRYPGAGNGED